MPVFSNHYHWHYGPEHRVLMLGIVVTVHVALGCWVWLSDRRQAISPDTQVLSVRMLSASIPVEAPVREPVPPPSVSQPKLAMPTQVSRVQDATAPVQRPPTPAAEAAVSTPEAQEPVRPKPVAEATPALAPPVVPPRFDAAYLNNPAPAYPALSRRNGEQGTVMLRVQVSADGQATDVRVEESSGYDRLDEAAKRAVQSWQFVPSRRGGESVPGLVLVPIHFSLTR